LPGDARRRPCGDNGATGQYGYGLFNRKSLVVTQQGIINAIMGAVAGR
jgi:endoglucanase